MAEKMYLGDSVYVEIESGMFKLTTWNGYPADPSNVIYLEPRVWEALRLYVETRGLDVVGDQTKDENSA